MQNVEDVNCTASFPVVSVCIEVMEGLYFNFLWRTCFRQVLGLLFIFSSELLFFSFYCKGKREKRGNMSCDSPVRCPLFFLQAPVDWFGWVPLTGLSWLPSRLTCGSFQFHHAPSPLRLSMAPYRKSSATERNL